MLSIILTCLKWYGIYFVVASIATAIFLGVGILTMRDDNSSDFDLSDEET